MSIWCPCPKMLAVHTHTQTHTLSMYTEQNTLICRNICCTLKSNNLQYIITVYYLFYMQAFATTKLVETERWCLMESMLDGGLCNFSFFIWLDGLMWTVSVGKLDAWSTSSFFLENVPCVFLWCICTKGWVCHAMTVYILPARWNPLPHAACFSTHKLGW